METSNQFPKQDKTKPDPLPIKERADFIFKNMESKMPELFEYIMKIEPIRK